MDEAQSAYAAAQQRYPSVLSSLTAQIQEADLGAKGIFYRVRVGPWENRDDAIEVCEALKAEGGNCFVTQ
jgi:cell division septation protein DedD